MHRLCPCLLVLAFACQASEDSTFILERARKAVAAQLARAANYACVQTIDRQYLVPESRGPQGCAQLPLLASETPLMRDRLRLDVAVSENREIYSWHGETKFTSSDVSAVVQTGPISSGNFVGFLRNIFLQPGAQFTFSGESKNHGSKAYNFDYIVGLKQSAYHIQAKSGKPSIPYHGSFSIDGSNYQLTRLQVVADAIPSDSSICSVETNITYQIVNVSGHPSLIPASFVLDLEDNRHVHTISSSQYSQCREFRGESNLRFDVADDSERQSAKQAKVDACLPAAVTLHITLGAAVDSRTAYVGDPVHGVLLHAVKLPGTATVLPKGAVLDGIITKLEDHQGSVPFQLFSINFKRLSFGDTSFVLNAWPETSLRDWNVLRKLYGSPPPDLVTREERRGLFVALSSHLQLDRHFSGTWITAIPPSASIVAARE